MRWIAAIILGVFLLAAVPGLAEEGPRIRKTDLGADIFTRIQIEPRNDDWFGPFNVDWLEYTLGDVYLEFTDGSWITLLASEGYDTGAIMAMATAARNHGRVIWVLIVDNRVSAIQVQ